MPSDYSPALVKNGTITLPSGGDPRTAASVGLPLSQLADWLAYEMSPLICSPPQITSNQNNYNPSAWSDCKTARIHSDAGRLIGGFGPGTNKTIVNIGAFSIGILHLAVGQTAGWQVSCPGDLPFILGPGDSAEMFYDITSGFWRIVGGYSRANNISWTGQHVWTNSCTFDASLTLKNGALIDHASAEYSYVAARSRTLYLPLTAATPAGAGHNSWALNDAGDTWFGVTNSAGLIFMPRLPSGAYVTAVTVGYVQPFGVSSGLELIASQINYTSGGSSRTPTVSVVGPTVGAPGALTMPLATGITIGPTTGLWICIKAPGSNAGLTTVGALSVTFNDPGPRNF